MPVRKIRRRPCPAPRRRQQADGIGQFRVPVSVEISRESRHNRPCRQNVTIAEIRLRMKIKVLVADVTSSDNAEGGIHGERFIVHAPVEALKC